MLIKCWSCSDHEKIKTKSCDVSKLKSIERVDNKKHFPRAYVFKNRGHRFGEGGSKLNRDFDKKHLHPEGV